jgi:hypothetical protein
MNMECVTMENSYKKSEKGDSTYEKKRWISLSKIQAHYSIFTLEKHVNLSIGVSTAQVRTL